jgi:hypothetical protein
MQGELCDMKLEPFHQGRLLQRLLALHVPYALLPPLIFLGYWVTPLLALIASQGLRFMTAGQAEAVLYLKDYTHLTYSLLISAGGLPVYVVLRKTSPVVRHTLRIVRGNSDQAYWMAKYRAYQSFAFNNWVVAACGALALAVFMVLLLRVYDDQYRGWWGHRSHGIAGLYFGFAAALMVFWATWTLLMVAAVSLVISHISRCKFSYEPLRADGCNGLRPVGLLIMIMWAYSLLAALAIYVVFSRGYLKLEENPVIWFISLTASICLPLVAILPLVSVTAAIRRARELYLLDIERLSKKRKVPASPRELDTLNNLMEVRKTVLKGNIFPFRNQAVLVFSILNIAQVILSTREILPK